MVHVSRELWVVSSALLFLGGCGGCGREKLVAAVCKVDSDCESGLLCDNYRCIPAESKSCQVVLDGNPILQPDPNAVALGDLDTPEATQTVTLNNLGNCTLTVFEASIAGGATSPFSCDECTTSTAFPLEVFPNRARPLELKLKATKVGQVSDELVIISDDKEFPELRVPLHARFLGVPKLDVTPNPVDFGYVAQGREGLKQVQVVNRGTGVAPVVIQSVTLDPANTQDFESTASLASPMSLAPIGAESGSLLSFELKYHPRTTAKHFATLVITTAKGVVTVPVTGNAETPPKVTVSPDSIDLGQVQMGHSNYRPLTIVNEGGAPLNVSYVWAGTNLSTDLFAVPMLIPPIAPGAYLELQVAVTVTAVQSYNAMLLLTTNDPAKPSITIPVTAEGVPSNGPEVVKVDMVFDNGSNSAFDEDIRNVDVSLEHPYGYVCNEQNPAPTNWGDYGNPTWVAFGPKKNPERIILADSIHDGTYRVMLQYQEDCSSLPSQLMAGILGVSVDVLWAILAGGIAPSPGQNIGQIISNVCLSHSSSEATVKVYVNGTLVKEKTTHLAQKGATTYALDLVRAGGAFTAQ